MAVLALSAYILFCYVTNRFDAYQQAFVTSGVLLTTLCLLIITRSPRRTLLYVLAVAHIGILVIWGNIVPFIALSPFFVTYLMTSEGYSTRVKTYLVMTLMINLLEVMGATPIIKQSFIEIGTPNLIITTILQSGAYFIWSYMLQLYSIIAGINFFGLDSSPTSPSFLRATLAKGLFMAMLLHYLNNLLNRALWQTPLDTRNLTILRLLGESERSEAVGEYTVGKVVGLAGIAWSAPIAAASGKKLNVHQAKVLFLLLANLEDNYRKYTMEHTCEIGAESETLVFTFVGKPKLGLPKKNLWERNLGTMRQYVELVGTGEIEVENKDIFATRLKVTR